MKNCYRAALLVLAAFVFSQAASAGELISSVRAQQRPWPVLSNTMTTTEMRLFAVRTSKAPTIDGKLDEAGWTKAFSVNTFGKIEFRGYSQRHNSARFLYDEKAIYIGCTGQISRWSTWLAEARGRDQDVWKDEAFEIFIDPGRTKKVYYQFIVNAVGSIQEGKGWNARYNPDWKVAVSHTDKMWTAEMAIPYAALEAAAPKAGDVWGINVCRDDKENKQISSVIPVASTFHDATAFAEIQFGDVPPAYLDYFSFDKIVKGNNTFRFKVLGSRVEGTTIRGRLTGMDGKPIGEAREVSASTKGYTEFPFSLARSGKFRLELDLLRAGKKVSSYKFQIMAYEERLMILIPGRTDFYQGQKSINLRFDMRIKAELLPSYRIEVLLKKGREVLRKGAVSRIPGVFISSRMDISGLPVGDYTVEALLLDDSGRRADSTSFNINVIKGILAAD